MKNSIKLKHNSLLEKLIDKPEELSVLIKVAFYINEVSGVVKKDFIGAKQSVINNLVLWGLLIDEEGMLMLADKKVVDITLKKKPEIAIKLDLKLLSEVKAQEVPKEDLKAYDIAESFRKLFLNNLESIKARTVNIDNAKYGKWVKPIKLMLSVDKVSVEDFRVVWRYLDKHSFWLDKVQSTEKLRLKFQIIHSQIKGDETRKSGGSKNSGNVSTEYVESVFRDLQSE